MTSGCASDTFIIAPSPRFANDLERQRIHPLVAHVRGEPAPLDRAFHPPLKLIRRFEQRVVRELTVADRDELRRVRATHEEGSEERLPRPRSWRARNPRFDLIQALTASVDCEARSTQSRERSRRGA